MRFRSTAANVCGWAFMVFAALNLLDLALHGRDVASVVATAALLFGCGLAYVIGLRPRILGSDDGVLLVNPLRDVRLPWSSVEKIESTDALTVAYTAADGTRRTARSWVFQSSPRARARADLRAGSSSLARGRTPAGFAAEQLTAARPASASAGTGASQAGDRVSVTWSIPAVAALAAPGLLLLGSILFATVH
ncbi:MAG TPA: PH domain-containing protein [Streptosporangiaceae bacterium]|nr:PH domain-containing protein [Streptosporangiaceae bacterium]